MFGIDVNCYTMAVYSLEVKRSAIHWFMVVNVTLSETE